MKGKVKNPLHLKAFRLKIPEMKVSHKELQLVLIVSFQVMRRGRERAIGLLVDKEERLVKPSKNDRFYPIYKNSFCCSP